MMAAVRKASLIFILSALFIGVFAAPAIWAQSNTVYARGIPNIPELNRRVLAFALEHLGKQVGDGECWTLGNEALMAAGAEPAKEYVFGKEVFADQVPFPGDIVQFTSCKFVEPYHKFQLGMPNHTAILYSLDGDKMIVLHQNHNNIRTVEQTTLNLKTLVSGSYKIYQPVALAKD